MKKNDVNQSVSLIALLVPFLGYYGYGFLNFAFIAICILYLYVLTQKGVIQFSNAFFFIYYILYYFSLRVMFGTSLSDRIAPSIFFVFLYWCFLNRNLNLTSFLKFYRVVAFVNISFFIIQELMYWLIGYRMSGIIPFLPSTLGENLDMNSFTDSVESADRSSAFFSEPAHFVQFLLPLLAIELLYVSNRKAYLRCFFYVLTLLGLASGNALLGISVIFLFYLIRLLKKVQAILAILYISLAVICAFVFISYIMTTEYGEKLLDRQEQIEPDQQRASSGFLRIFRGYYVLDVLTPIQKSIGLNSHNRLKDAIKKSDVAALFGENDIYFNAVQSVLLYTGYIGTALFVLGLWGLWKGNNLAGKCCIMIFVALSFIAAIFFSYTMVFMLVCSALMLKENKSPSFFVFKIF